jgi:hypothetical protein
MDKENWINEVLESTRGMRKAEPSPFLFDQISARIQKGKKVVEGNPFLKWGLTSVVLIIMSLNILFIADKSDTKTTTEVVVESDADNYFNNTITYNY